MQDFSVDLWCIGESIKFKCFKCIGCRSENLLLGFLTLNSIGINFEKVFIALSTYSKLLVEI